MLLALVSALEHTSTITADNFSDFVLLPKCINVFKMPFLNNESKRAFDMINWFTNCSKAISAFFKKETAAGLVMLFFVFSALVIANSPLSALYFALIKSPFGLNIGFWEFSLPFDEFVKEVLMVFFFFNIGMELKKEISVGFLKEKTQILTPFAAAIAGMVCPALIYVFFNHGDTAALQGWAVPCATDIAFALCILLLAGKNVNPAVKIFLLAIAVFDDIGAIMIIAFFYGSGISYTYLIMGFACITAMIVVNRLSVSNILVYGILGGMLWAAFIKAGISTSIAGVISGLLIPYSAPFGKGRNKLERAIYPINNNLARFTPWVNFLVLPLFAFTESGIKLIDMSLSDFTSSITLGVIFGLFLGKQLGIFGITYIMLKLKMCQFPIDVRLNHIYAVSVISAIGFTMSLFISKLAFDNQAMLEEAKLGILISALLASVTAFAVLRMKTENKNST